MKDVAGVVARLEAIPLMSSVQQILEATQEAASTIRALVAENERLTQERTEAVERYVPAAQYINDLTANVATLTRHIGEQSARAEAAEAKMRAEVQAWVNVCAAEREGRRVAQAKLREAVEVIRFYADNYAGGRAQAFLATMEKPND